MPSTPVIAHATPLVAVPPAGEWCVSSEGRPSTAAGSRDLCILCTHIDARRGMHARAAAPVPLQCSERSICQHLPPGTASASACAGARGTAGAGAGRRPRPRSRPRTRTRSRPRRHPAPTVTCYVCLAAATSLASSFADRAHRDASQSSSSPPAAASGIITSALPPSPPPPPPVSSPPLVTRSPHQARSASDSAAVGPVSLTGSTVWSRRLAPTPPSKPWPNWPRK